MGQQRPIRERRGEKQEATIAAPQPTFLGDELRGDAHLEGREDRGVVTGDDVIGAACGREEQRADWTVGWLGRGKGRKGRGLP